MEEKVLIESERYKLFRIKWKIPIIIWCVIFVLYVVSVCIQTGGFWFSDIITNVITYGILLASMVVLGPIALIYLFLLPFYLTMRKSKMTVTDKRVFGTAIFGKRVDLPLDSISAVGTSAFHGIGVATASGMVKFKLIKNRDEIHKVVSDLLLERQQKPVVQVVQEAPQAPQVNASAADELKKFKELLDSGVITQEEFDAKKKQLLGL